MRQRIFTALIILSCALLAVGCGGNGNGNGNGDGSGDGAGDGVGDGTGDGTGDGEQTELTSFAPAHYFVGNDDPANTNSTQLWRTDGTAQGTEMVKDITPGNDADIQELTLVEGTLFFTADDGDGPQVWTSDGTDAGTQKISDIDLAADTRPTMLTAAGDTLFFVAEDTDGEALWKTDGTDTEMVLAVERPGSLTAMGDTLFFAGDDGVHGVELWTSDGTEAGTEMVRDIWEGNGNALMGTFGPTPLVVIGDMVYFAASDSSGSALRQLWKSDGTEAGTEMVRDFDDTVARLTASGDMLYFYAEGDLWITDGTEAGTSVILDGDGIDFSDALHQNGGGIPLGDNLIFAARDTDAGDDTRLWITDGSEATPIQGEINLNVARFVANRVTVGDTVYFISQAESSSANILWKTDGTEAGTESITMAGNIGADDAALTIAGDGETLLFGTRDLGTGAELWRSDGTAAGTQMITDLCPEACDGFLGH